jgi:tRNA threonylcarbamoyladenosine modification (KEOPS) complex  Pcc1 subunit
LKNAKAEAAISIDFPTKSDAEAIVRAVLPEIAAPRMSRASIRVTRRGKVARITFIARDLVALRAMVNSFLRYAAVWRKLSEALKFGDNRARRTRRSTTQKQDEYLV